MTWDADNSQLVMGSLDKEISVWSIYVGKCVSIFMCPQPVNILKVVPERGLLFAGLEKGKVLKFKIKNL